MDLIQHVENQILEANLKELKVADLKTYLKCQGLDDKGKKEQLIDRILVFMEHKNSIWYEPICYSTTFDHIIKTLQEFRAR